MTEPFPAKKYAVIYADPPWGYHNKGTRAADRHYSTMSIIEIIDSIHDGEAYPMTPAEEAATEKETIH